MGQRSDPMLDPVWVPISLNKLGVFEAELTTVDGKVAAEPRFSAPSVAALRFSANPLRFVSPLQWPFAKEQRFR